MKITSVADAVAAMDYLHKRELLCDRCGIKLATLRNANHSRCEDCRPPHGEMFKNAPANELERRLCEAVGEWLSDDSPDTRTVAEGGPEPAADTGKAGA